MTKKSPQKSAAKVSAKPHTKFDGKDDALCDEHGWTPEAEGCPEAVGEGHYSAGHYGQPRRGGQGSLDLNYGSGYHSDARNLRDGTTVRDNDQQMQRQPGRERGPQNAGWVAESEGRHGGDRDA